MAATAVLRSSAPSSTRPTSPPSIGRASGTGAVTVSGPPQTSSSSAPLGSSRAVEVAVAAGVACGRPAGTSEAQTTAPTRKMIEATRKALSYPASAAVRCEVPTTARAVAVAVPAIEDSSAVPTEPPTCCIVFTVAEATPASCGSTPSVAVLIEVDIAVPMPRPMTISGPSTLPA